MAETMVLGGWFAGYLVIAGLAARLFMWLGDDEDMWPMGFFWPVVLCLAVVLGIPVLIVGTIAGSIKPLDPFRDWQRERQIARARRIAEAEAELIQLLEDPR